MEFSKLVHTPSPLFKSLIKTKDGYLQKWNEQYMQESTVLDRVQEHFARGKPLRNSDWKEASPKPDEHSPNGMGGGSFRKQRTKTRFKDGGASPRRSPRKKISDSKKGSSRVLSRGPTFNNDITNLQISAQTKGFEIKIFDDQNDKFMKSSPPSQTKSEESIDRTFNNSGFVLKAIEMGSQ